jgi:hypothetical protein
MELIWNQLNTLQPAINKIIRSDKHRTENRLHIRRMENIYFSTDIQKQTNKQKQNEL